MRNIWVTQAVVLLLVAQSGCVERNVDPGAPRIVERQTVIPTTHIQGDTSRQLVPPPVAQSEPRPSSSVEPSAAERLTNFAFRVQAGESWEDLERWSGLSRAEIRATSGLRRARGLRSGTELLVRLAPDEVERFVRMRREHHRRVADRFFRRHRVVRIGAYVIQQGDSPRAVATKEGNDVPTWLMERVNPTADLNRLRPGDIINVPFVVAAPPVTPREAKARSADVDRFLRTPRSEAWAPDSTPTRPLTAPKPWQAAPPVAAPAPVPAHVRPAPRRNWFADGDPVALAAPTPAVEPHAEAVRVRRREYLAIYAKWAGVPVSDIMAFNGITDPRQLRVGQTIRVPMPESRVADFCAARRAYHSAR